MIYFARRATGGPIKITATVSVRNHLAYLVSKYHCEFRVLGVLDGADFSMGDLKDRFDHLRVDGFTWFEAAPTLLDFINTHGHPYRPPPRASRQTALPKINSSLARKARRVAADRGMSVEAYVESLMRPQLDHDFLMLIKREIENDPDLKRMADESRAADDLSKPKR